MLTLKDRRALVRRLKKFQSLTLKPGFLGRKMTVTPKGIGLSRSTQSGVRVEIEVPSVNCNRGVELRGLNAGWFEEAAPYA